MHRITHLSLCVTVESSAIADPALLEKQDQGVAGALKGWPLQQPWPPQQPATPMQQPVQQPPTPPSLVVMERELDVLEGEQAADPTNATHAGRIRGLQADIKRYRRKRRLM